MRYTKLLSLLILLSSLCACSTTRTVEPVIQRVEIPIEVPCKTTLPLPPDYNFNKLSRTDTTYDKVSALLADRLLSRGYEAELVAKLNSCIK